MGRKKTSSLDWKVKLKDSCPCFVSELSKPEPSRELCILPCDLKELKDVLIQTEIPTRKEIIRAMIQAGIFKKKEIIGALLEIFETVYRSAERRIEETINEMKDEQYQVFTDDTGNLKARK